MFDIDFLTILSSKPGLFTGVFLFILLAIEISSRLYKHSHKRDFDSEKEDADIATLSTLTVAYNKRLQLIEIIRVLGYILFALLMLLAYDVQAFSYILLAIGALIIALKESVTSFFAYFFIVYLYDIGDDVKVGNTLGEIVRIHTLTTRLAGKEENGEYNGKLITIPNHMFMQGVVEKKELKMSSFRHVTIKTVYNPVIFNDSFTEWLHLLKAFLEENLPVRKLGSVGHFRGFAGIKYKINYEYNEDGYVVVSISFVSSSSSALHKKESIVTFIEGSKKRKIEQKLENHLEV